MNIFKEIGKGVVWFAKEIGKGFTELPKLITLTDDARQIASEAIPKILALLDAVKALVTASIKDGGMFFSDLAALGAAVTAAVASECSPMADAAVLTAIEKLVSDFKASSVADVLAAWKALVEAAQALDATVAADLKKLVADA